MSLLASIAPTSARPLREENSQNYGALELARRIKEKNYRKRPVAKFPLPILGSPLGTRVSQKQNTESEAGAQRKNIGVGKAVSAVHSSCCGKRRNTNNGGERYLSGIIGRAKIVVCVPENWKLITSKHSAQTLHSALK